MINNLLALVDGAGVVDPDFGARLAQATEVLVRGMLTVFAVLAIIWLSLTVLRYFVYDLPNKRKNKAPTAPATREIAPAVTQQADVAAPENGELIAVIAAAIAASSGEDTSSFRVVSFKRIRK